MSLKNIRQNYSKLLSAFQSTGIKLTESQKADLDTFILALESHMSSQKKATIKATKKVVTERLENEYRTVFESLTKHQAENAILASKIQGKIRTIKESKKMANSISDYLELYVESVLPKKSIVDYTKMKKLETVFESLKDTLLVNDDVIESKKLELVESFKKDKNELQSKVALLQAKLNESMKKELSLNKAIKLAKGKELVESKVKDLPLLEARKVSKRLVGLTPVEVEAKFKPVLESIKREIEEEKNSEETTLEQEISDIIKSKETKDKKRAVSEKEVKKEKIAETTKDDEDLDEESDDLNDVELDDSEKIEESIMRQWISRCGDISTKGY